MSIDIQLGEVEHVQPEARRRPDRNRHFAVSAYGNPLAGELPIFVNLDVMRDMEAHAASDTSVELGGVLLGGQYLDEAGQEFVLVADALRAKHYEATKGSFKFTHDTWSQITRERDEFPDELQMVGWYHTHPDWGVFLSGMDQFICDHFFNKPLDVALVIDPCRKDRGFFQWSEDAQNRLPRTGGFYLIASRFRGRELERFATHLEGKYPMKTEGSHTDYAYHPGLYPAPVIHNHLAERQPSWFSFVLVAMLAVQICLLLWVTWRVDDPSMLARSTPTESSNHRVGVLADPLQSSATEPFTARETIVGQQFLQEILGELNVVTDGLSGKLQKEREANQTLRAAVVGVQALEDRVAQLDKDMTRVTKINQELQEKLGVQDKSRKVLEADNESLKERIDALEEEIDERVRENKRYADEAQELARLDPGMYKKWRQAIDEKEATNAELPTSTWSWWQIAIAGATVLIVAAILGGTMIARRRRYFVDDSQDRNERAAPRGVSK